MIRIIIAAFLFFFITGCNSSGTKDKPASDSLTVSIDSSGKTEPGSQQTGIITAVKLTAEQIPKELKFRGKVNEAWQWTDKLGDNILITSFVEPYPDKQKNEYEEDAKTSELHAFHFVKKDTAYKLLWKISDAEKSCPFDITAAFIKDAITVTDLDKDGIAETSIQYKLACRSDVSPAYMKLILHEDTVKYSLRGVMWVRVSDTDKFTVTENDVDLEKLPKKKDEYENIMQSFGRYETEKEFASAPPEFLNYARGQWIKYVKESFD